MSSEQERDVEQPTCGSASECEPLAMPQPRFAKQHSSMERMSHKAQVIDKNSSTSEECNDDHSGILHCFPWRAPKSNMVSRAQDELQHTIAEGDKDEREETEEIR